MKKPVVISDVEDEANYITFHLPGGAEVSVLRLDYIDEDTFDLMNADLEALDAEQQFIGVAADIASSEKGAKLQWQPLFDDAKNRLVELGADIHRVTKDGARYDEISGDPEVFAEWADKKPLPLRRRAREVALTTLKYVVEDDELKHFTKLRLGQLNQIISEWRNQSRVTAGE